MSRQTLGRAHRAGLSDEDVLHVITLASYFGHLNRIADAGQAPLDYTVKLEPPHADPAIAPWRNTSQRKRCAAIMNTSYRRTSILTGALPIRCSKTH